NASPTCFPRASGWTMTAPMNASLSYVVEHVIPTRFPARRATKHPSGSRASSRSRSARVYPQFSRSVRRTAQVTSRFVRTRTSAPATVPPSAGAPRPRRSRDSRTSRTAFPSAHACTCTARTRHPPGRTTCRSPCTGGGRAAASAVPPDSHPPKRIRTPLDLGDLVQGFLLVRVKRLVPEGPCGLFREVHEQDVSALHLAANGDALHG